MDWYPGEVSKGWEWRKIPLAATTREYWAWVFVTRYANGGEAWIVPDWRFM